MKKIILVLLMGLMSLSGYSAGSKIEESLDGLVKDLVSEYQQKNEIVLKKNLAILDFENISPDAKKLQLGQAFRDLISSRISQAPAFNIIERKHLKKIMKEQSLQMAGVTENTVNFGEILNADVLLYGTITELGDSFNVSITMVDVETGEQINQLLSLKKTALIQTVKKYEEMKYVQKMGIGISILASSSGITGDAASFYIPVLYDLTGVQPFDTFFNRGDGIELRYRFTKNIMIGFGITQVWGQLRYIENQVINLNAILTNFVNGTTGNMTLEAEGITTPLNLYFNFNPATRLSLYGAIGLEWITLQSSGIFKNQAGLGGKGFGKNQIFPQGFIDGMLYNVKAGAEYFLTPRLSVAVSVGYQFGGFRFETGPYQIFYPDLPQNINVKGLVLSLEIPLYF